MLTNIDSLNVGCGIHGLAPGGYGVHSICDAAMDNEFLSATTQSLNVRDPGSSNSRVSELGFGDVRFSVSRLR